MKVPKRNYYQRMVNQAVKEFLESVEVIQGAFDEDEQEEAILTLIDNTSERIMDGNTDLIKAAICYGTTNSEWIDGSNVPPAMAPVLQQAIAAFEFDMVNAAINKNGNVDWEYFVDAYDLGEYTDSDSYYNALTAASY